jgi:hypothetical protein
MKKCTSHTENRYSNLVQLFYDISEVFILKYLSEFYTDILSTKDKDKVVPVIKLSTTPRRRIGGVEV